MELQTLAVEAKRKAPCVDVEDASWKVAKCQKLSSEKFMVRLEISSPDSFSVKPLSVDGYRFPGDAACFEKLSECLSNVCYLIYVPHWVHSNDSYF